MHIHVFKKNVLKLKHAGLWKLLFDIVYFIWKIWHYCIQYKKSLKKVNMKCQPKSLYFWKSYIILKTCSKVYIRVFLGISCIFSNIQQLKLCFVCKKFILPVRPLLFYFLVYENFSKKCSLAGRKKAGKKAKNHDQT